MLKAQIILASLVLLPPLFLAGGTLPAAARAVETEGDRRRRGLAVLYGVNTLGGALGAVASIMTLRRHLATW